MSSHTIKLATCNLSRVLQGFGHRVDLKSVATNRGPSSLHRSVTPHPLCFPVCFVLHGCPSPSTRQRRNTACACRQSKNGVVSYQVRSCSCVRQQHQPHKEHTHTWPGYVCMCVCSSYFVCLPQQQHRSSCMRDYLYHGSCKPLLFQARVLAVDAAAVAVAVCRLHVSMHRYLSAGVTYHVCRYAARVCPSGYGVFIPGIPHQ